MMKIHTLRGVFPEPKTVYKRNFIKENMQHIKQMQGLLPQTEAKLITKDDTYTHKQQKQKSGSITKYRNKSEQVLQGRSKMRINTQRINQPTRIKSKLGKNKLEIKELKHVGAINGGDAPACAYVENDKFTHRGIQTESVDNWNKLCESGVIKYPSPSVIEDITRRGRRSNRDAHNSTDVSKNNTNRDIKCVQEKMENIELDDAPNFIKQNIEALKIKPNKQDTQDGVKQLPPKYQKGVVPKYLREQKGDKEKVLKVDPECPEGHILLPEDERKETLRVLRQSYADRIQELNSMPVRNDTLKMRKRKMEIEEDLKKIDEGIKVFQRPKVFVKINA